MLTMNRAWDIATWMGTTEHLCTIMTVLAERDPREDGISPVTDTIPRPKHKPGDTLPLHVASNGIGAAGSIAIGADVWEKRLPRHIKRALAVAPDLGDSDDQALAVLAKAMHRDGLLIRCRDDLTANLRAFSKPKSQEKGALIADLRLLNAMMGPAPRPFELPSMRNWLHSLNSCGPRTFGHTSPSLMCPTWSGPCSCPKSIPVASGPACEG